MAPTTSKASPPKPKTNPIRKGGPGRIAKANKPNKARDAMVAMQAFFKENRSKYKDLAFKDQQKELGAEWKTSAKNPKNKA
ncbi:hypothetical protein K505DRAFT_366645 [Melanomma pulvis-pyrius CBS 109.77]|uniref:Uncharacterized protein n=1 Tax=Melanomma pulvis-pyrius CBS 109.77 TaxID=1314802 RepID=A0A6A6WWE5_9PLEO|nr:hypothetical protein K505DRAFT_366645 [Melanomma pulvis-pyrius CBS 109.77]